MLLLQFLEKIKFSIFDSKTKSWLNSVSFFTQKWSNLTHCHKSLVNPQLFNYTRSSACKELVRSHDYQFSFQCLKKVTKVYSFLAIAHWIIGKMVTGNVMSMLSDCCLCDNWWWPGRVTVTTRCTRCYSGVTRLIHPCVSHQVSHQSLVRLPHFTASTCFNQW